MIRVKDVMPRTSEGNTVSAVINARICNDNEYVEVPSSPPVILNAGRPGGVSPISWASAPLITPHNERIAIGKEVIRIRTKQNNTRLACFGSTTQKEAENHGLIVDIPAPTPDAPSMTKAISDYIKDVNKK